MNISINGESREVMKATTVAGLVEELSLPAQALLIEHNGLALRREEWPAQSLVDGDQIEFIRIVAGG